MSIMLNTNLSQQSSTKIKTKTKKKNISKIVISTLLYAELTIVCLAVLIPIIWIIGASLTEGSSLSSTSLFPEKITFEHYRALFAETNYGLWFMNTLKIAIVNTVISLIIIMVSSWILSRFQFKAKKPSLMTLLLLSMFPTFLTMTAIYTLFLTFGMLNNPMSLVIIYSAGALPYNCWLVKGYLDGIPKDIDEAAYIDGCTRFQSFFKMVLPLSLPIMTYCAVTQFMMPWMDYILPNLLLSKDSSKTLAVGLYSMISGKENSSFTMFAAGAVLVAIPITIVFFIFQKYLTEGIAAGASK